MEAIDCEQSLESYKLEGRGLGSRYCKWNICIDLSGRTTALESTQPPLEMSARNTSWVAKATGAYG